MRSKYIFIIIFLIVVGFATVSTTMYLNGTSLIKSNSDDFKVYYSDVLVNGTQDLSVVVDDTHLLFNTTLDTLGQEYVLDYDVTNSSKNYDAALTMNCTGGNEYLSVVNTFDTTNNLLATETRSGKLTLTLSKSYVGDDLDVEIVCTLSASAVERDTLGSGEVPDPVEPIPVYEPQQGDELCIGSECFYVISSDENEVAMLAKYNLLVGYETSTLGEYEIANPTGLQDSSTGYGYGAIDWYYEDDDDEYIEFYSSYINNDMGVTSTVDSMTYKNFIDLGCDPETLVCEGAPDWLFGNYFASYVYLPSGYGSVISVEDSVITIYDQEISYVFKAYPEMGVRPVVTISKDIFYELYGDKILMDPVYFCNELGFTYGMFKINSYALYVEEGNYEDVLYLCSNDEDYDAMYGYDLNKNLVYYNGPLSG